MKNGCERGAEWLKVETNIKMVIKPVEKSEEHKTKLNKKNSEDKKRRDFKKKTWKRRRRKETHQRNNI